MTRILKHAVMGVLPSVLLFLVGACGNGARQWVGEWQTTRMDGENASVKEIQRSGLSAAISMGFHFYAGGRFEKTWARVDLFRFAGMPVPSDSYVSYVSEGQYNVDGDRFSLVLEAGRWDVSPSVQRLGIPQSTWTSLLPLTAYGAPVGTVGGTWALESGTLTLRYDHGATTILRRLRRQ